MITRTSRNVGTLRLMIIAALVLRVVWAPLILSDYYDITVAGMGSVKA